MVDAESVGRLEKDSREGREAVTVAAKERLSGAYGSQK